MHFYAIGTAGNAVVHFIDVLNDHVYGQEPYKAARAGERRAQQRLFLKREANKKIPDGSKMTRQRRRWEARKGLVLQT